jgi:hypothetical protein
MRDLLSNPAALIALVCVGALIIGLHLTLFGLLTGSKAVHAEASKWGKALRGGQDARRHQEHQMDELHRLVSELAEQGRETKDE